MRTSRKIRALPAPKERTSFTISGSTARSPSAVATATGKNTISPTTITLGRRLNPNQMTRTAATAGIGMV